MYIITKIRPRICVRIIPSPPNKDDAEKPHTAILLRNLYSILFATEANEEKRNERKTPAPSQIYLPFVPPAPNAKMQDRSLTEKRANRRRKLRKRKEGKEENESYVHRTPRMCGSRRLVENL